MSHDYYRCPAAEPWYNPMRSAFSMIALVIICGCTPVKAYGAAITLEDLVADCDLIVAGELQEFETSIHSWYRVSSVRIRVDRVIWPPVEPVRDLMLLYRNLAVPWDTDHAIDLRNMGRRPVLWCLRWAGEDSVTARHDAWRELDELPEILDVIRAHPISAQVHPWPWAFRQFEKEVLPELHVVYRNAGTDTLEFPAITESDSALELHVDIGLEVAMIDKELRHPRAACPLRPILYSFSRPTLILPPGQERRIVIHLNDYYPYGQSFNFVRIGIGTHYRSGLMKYRGVYEYDDPGHDIPGAVRRNSQ